MEKINEFCVKAQQYIRNLTSDSVIMSVLLAFLAIFLLKGLRLSKKEILRALLILCIVNCIILNLYLQNNKRMMEENGRFNYFDKAMPQIQITNTQKRSGIEEVFQAKNEGSSKRMNQAFGGNENAVQSGTNSKLQKQLGIDRQFSNGRQSQLPTGNSPDSQQQFMFQEGKTLIL